MLASLPDAYKAYGEENDAGAAARRLLDQQHWYNSLAEFDPKTGQALPLGLDEVLRRLTRRQETSEVRDRLWRIAEHSRASVARLFDALNESPRREQATLHIRAVRELNATSLIALNRRPGRNIREKLASNPYLQAVRRYQSIDLPENRLLKAYVSRLAELLELRAKYLQIEDPLLATIHRWMHSEEAEAISRWSNLPPNNTLLSHKDYRRVWDAWRWLQTLDDDTARDVTQTEARAALIAEWQGHAAALMARAAQFGDMPVMFDYDKFSIAPWMPRLASRSAKRTDPEPTPPASADEAVCVDVTGVRPAFATTAGISGSLADTYLWQRWQRDDERVDIELFEADFPMLHPESTTIAAPDLLFRADLDPALADTAAHSFARRLRSQLPSPALTWLIPDRLNEFDLAVLRRNLNARFASAEPLPRSVAAVFASVEHKRIKREGLAVLVVDTTGGVTTATRLVAKIDSELAERVPDTHGYYWERNPTVTLGEAREFDPLGDIAYVGAGGKWHEAAPGPEPLAYTEAMLRSSTQIEPFDEVIHVTGSPVVGGVKTHELQHAAGDIPVWRDHIPELSIKVHVGGRYQPFYLVDKHTTIRPIRGLAVEIPVIGRFTLPAGRPYYKFPLYQGSDAGDLGFEARLESPAFPLAADMSCRLTMTYTYGADEPYRLVLTALDGSIPPIHVKWRPKTDDPIADAPAPGYPTPLTWAELQHNYYAAKDRWNDYLDWLVSATERILNTIENPTITQKRVYSGTIGSDWKVSQKTGKYFTFVDDLYIGESALSDGVQRANLRIGSRVFYDIKEFSDGRRAANNVSTEQASIRQRKPVDPGAIRVGLYVPYIKIWGDARSVSDLTCPPDFRKRIETLVPGLERAMRAQSTPVELQREIRFLLCCMHRDMPWSVSHDLVAGATEWAIDDRAYAFALGDLSQDWQKNVFLAVWNRSDIHTLMVLAQAIWRTSTFVRVFDAASLAWLSDLLLSAMRDVNLVAHPGKDELSRVAMYGELLLGLLRSRESEVEEVRLTLQAHQERTKLLADQVELAAGLAERSGLALRSRVEIADLPDKPEGDRTPDLLYALRLYLTGDVGASAIRVTGVLDSEED